MIDPDAAVCAELTNYIKTGIVSIIGPTLPQTIGTAQQGLLQNMNDAHHFIYVYQMHGGVVRIAPYECAAREKRRRKIRERCLKHLGI